MTRFLPPAGAVSLVVAEVNSAPGIVALRGRRPMAVIVLASHNGLVTGIYAIADEAKLSRVR